MNIKYFVLGFAIFSSSIALSMESGDNNFSKQSTQVPPAFDPNSPQYIQYIQTIIMDHQKNRSDNEALQRKLHEVYEYEESLRDQVNENNKTTQAVLSAYRKLEKEKANKPYEIASAVGLQFVVGAAQQAGGTMGQLLITGLVNKVSNWWSGNSAQEAVTAGYAKRVAAIQNKKINQALYKEEIDSLKDSIGTTLEAIAHFEKMFYNEDDDAKRDIYEAHLNAKQDELKKLRAKQDELMLNSNKDL